MNTFKILALASCIIVAGCTTNETGKQIVDAESVKNAALLACLIAPTSAEIIKLYTENKKVETTEQAVNILCRAATPFLISGEKK